MPLNRWLMVAAAGAALLAGIFLSIQLRNAGQDPNETVGLADLELPDLNGHIVTASQWQGNVVLINFWATWCPPCVEEIPLFIHLRNTYADKGFEVVGIAIDDPAKVRRFSKELAIDYPLLNGNEQGIQLMQRYHNRLGALPYSVLFDRHGKAVRFKAGAFTADELETLLQSYF